MIQMSHIENELEMAHYIEQYTNMQLICIGNVDYKAATNVVVV